MEYKRFSAGFVLATLLVIDASAACADDLPLPPPPPPPGANPLPPPTTPIDSGILEAPPPPPPGVNIEPPPSAPDPKPPPPAPVPSPTPSAPAVLPPPPTPPPGTNVTPPRDTPKDKPKRLAWPTKTRDQTPSINTHPDYSPADQYRLKNAGKWYGWQSMIGLVPVYGLFIAGVESEEEVLFIPAALGAALVTPIAHWAHRNNGRGWLSFGLNFGAPLIGSIAGGGYGALVGLGLWNAIDVVGLHYVQPPAGFTKRTASIVQSFAILPMMDQGRKGFSIVGQF